MRTNFVPPSGLLSRDSVQLGRLIRNPIDPHDDYHYPFPDAEEHPKLIITSQTNFQEIIARSASLWARLKLSSIGAIATKANEAKTYQLDNSSDWFRKACKTKDTREWILQGIKDGARMYLTVGYHVIVDALVYERRGEMGSPESRASEDSNTTLVARIDSSNGHEREYGAPGEHIYAVQYRKLRFKWFSSRDVDQAVLEPTNRWKLSLGARGEEDGDEDDVLEADLADGMDVKGGEGFMSEDGLDEFVFDWDEDEDEEDDENE
jgi:hypothetical protein